jgi:type IV pilus assembly protein PilW
MRRRTIRELSRRPAGFSMVELMVAMVIALIGTIVIFQVFEVFEERKRTTTSGGDAQQNGLFALFSVERDARMAGFGINHLALLGCSVRGYHQGPPARDFTFRLVAVQIAEGAAGAPDSVTFMFGNSDLLMTPVKLIRPKVAASVVQAVDNRYGFRPGDLIIAAQAGRDCTLNEVTGIPGTPGQTDNVIHNPGNYTNAQGANVPARYNKAGGLGIDYAAWDNTTQSGGVLYNIGAAPTVVTYSVQNAQLALQNLLLGGAASGIVDGIVQLQARYGLDTNDDGAVEAWRDGCAAATDLPLGAGGACVAATAADWARVIALRLAVVARSAQPERPNPATGLCETTTAAPTWFGGAITLAADPNWQCYRYRVLETAVPIRNLIWKPA